MDALTSSPLPPDVNIGTSVMKAVWANLGISSVVVIARVGVKCRTARRLFYDDVLIIIALLFGYIHAICITQAYQNGLGRHIFYLDEQQLSETLRYGFFSLAWGFLSPMAGRLSFCTFILWVSGTNPIIKKWPIFVFMILQVVINIVAVIIAYAECGTHLDILWTPSKAAETTTLCWAPEIQSYYGYFSGSFNTLTDIFLTIIPAIIVWKTKMTTQARLGLTLLLCLSSLAMIASIVKTKEAKDLSERSDYTYDLVDYIIWISVELNIVMVAASIPILRPLFTRGGLSRLARRPQMSARETRSPSTGSSIAMSKQRPRVATRHLSSTSSQEDILARDPNDSFGEESVGITRTVEVSVTYAPNDATWVHAALVGLPTSD